MLGISVASASESHSDKTETIGQPSTDPDSDCEIVILGASYAGGWKIDKLLGCKVINQGIDGNQSHEMLDRFASDVSTKKPRYVLIWGFINDIFRSAPEKMPQVRNRIKESYQSMVKLAQEQQIAPILATEVTIRPKTGWAEDVMALVGGFLGKSSYQDYINQIVTEENQWLRSFAVDQGIQLLDFEATLAEESGQRHSDYAVEDGSHISVAGYEALTNYVHSQVK